MMPLHKDEEVEALKARIEELLAEVARRDALIKSDGFEDMRRHAQDLAQQLGVARDECDDALRDEDIARALLGNAQGDLEAANADRARLSHALKDTLDELDEHVLDHDKVSQETVTKRWRVEEAARLALASSDASQWLRERERRVAERVREETLRLAFFRLKSDLGAGQAQAVLGRVIDELRATPLDALLKEET